MSLILKKNNLNPNSYPDWVSINPLYKYIWYSIWKDNRNELIIVTGRPGSCKSGFALRLAHDLSLEWKDDRKNWVSKFKTTHIVFDIESLVTIATSNLRHAVVVYDEAGVESDNTTYQDLRSKILRWVLQTWRYKNNVLVLTCPTYKSLTAGITRLATIHVECYGRRRGEKRKAHARVTFLQHGGRKGKEYEKYIRYTDVIDGVSVKRKMIDYVFYKPLPALEIEYESLKKSKTNSWYELFNKELGFMKSFLGDKNNNNKKTSKVAEETYNTYKEKLEEFTTIKGKTKVFSPAMFEKRMMVDKISLSEGSLRTILRLLRADFDAKQNVPSS